MNLIFLGVFFGRIGCLLNGCCYGGRCEPGWASLRFPPITKVYQEQLASGELLGMNIDLKTGKVIWDFDSTRSFETVNGVTASGGSMGGASGPVLHGSSLLFNSGYSLYFHMPGNVLLVFDTAGD